MDLSILIPARNEMFLANTVNDILKNMRGDTEIIIVLDGAPAIEPIPEHERVHVIMHSASIGQRAATNEAARYSQAKYVMKCDAHCAFDEGFDVKMMADMQDDITMIPTMYNLHVFDWVCQSCGKRRYQSRSGPCEQCGGNTEREIVWKAKRSPETTAMRFDRDLKFQYWSQHKQRQSGDLVETMSLLGACFMLTRERYFALNICDEAHGSWGQQGTEVACKTWLSGGRLLCTRKTWFAHMFRTQGGDFGFPYSISSADVNAAREYSRWLWLGDNWEGAVHPLSWLVKKFWPVPDWDEPEDCAGPTKGIVYYTDNRLDSRIDAAVKARLLETELPIVSVSLKPVEDFGENIVIDAERGNETMFKQILAGLEAIDTDIVFFAEHDVLYHPSHFEFTPPEKNLFYYNNNVWRVDANDGKALFYYSNHTSQLCAYRDLLLEHYRKRLALVQERGFSRRMGYEPGTHHREERVDDTWHDTWMSPVPNIDIRHRNNLTQSRWKKEQFRNQRYTRGWTKSDSVPGWGITLNNFGNLLEGVANGTNN